MLGGHRAMCHICAVAMKRDLDIVETIAAHEWNDIADRQHLVVGLDFAVGDALVTELVAEEVVVADLDDESLGRRARRRTRFIDKSFGIPFSLCHDQLPFVLVTLLISMP